ncbi:MAG: hypothetical protein MJB14_19740, partial [Spirochaetes bacterium]|nr:hypothetical protein [Spirochaetota bacterium]
MKIWKNIKKLFISVCDFFYNLSGGKKNDLKNVRRVYFGLKIRLITFLGVLLFFILMIFSVIILNLQRSYILDEKRKRTDYLAQTLSALFESYIDQTNSASRQSRSIQLKAIADNCNYFKQFNDDIFKIYVTDEKGNIIHSTYKNEINTKTKGSYVYKSLQSLEVVSGYKWKEEKINYE